MFADRPEKGNSIECEELRVCWADSARLRWQHLIVHDMRCALPISDCDQVLLIGGRVSAMLARLLKLIG